MKAKGIRFIKAYTLRCGKIYAFSCIISPFYVLASDAVTNGGKGNFRLKLIPQLCINDVQMPIRSHLSNVIA